MYKVFKHKRGYCFYDLNKTRSYKISTHEADILKPQNGNSAEKVVLLDKYNISKRSSGKIKDISISSLDSLSIMVAQECNMKCIYCYGDDGSYGLGGILSRECAKKTIDWFFGQAKNKKLKITFFGGEPLLNFPVIEFIVSYIKKVIPEKEKSLFYSITTNGLLLDDKIINFFKENKIKPMISIDGPKRIHDLQRPDKKGNPTYDKLIKKIKNLLKIIPESSCRATIINEEDHEEIVESLEKIGFKYQNIFISPVTRPLNVKAADYIEYKVNHNKYLKQIVIDADLILSYISEKKTEMLERTFNSYWKFLISAFLNNVEMSNICGAGKTGLAVSTQGDFYLCHRFVGMDDYKYGNNMNGICNGHCKVETTYKKKQCKRCFAKSICGSGCYHDNLSKTGSINMTDKKDCQINKAYIKHSAIITSLLSDDDKIFLFDSMLIRKRECLLDLF
jgi:uncharacterized protein